MNKSFTPISIPAGGTSTLSVSIYNPNPFALTLSVLPPAWTDTLPVGMNFASPPDITTTCGGTVSAVGSTLSLAGGTVAAQVGTTPGSCTVTIDVTSTTVGNLINTIPADTLNATDPTGTIEVANSTPASATLQVNAVQPPSLSKGFSPNTIWVGQPSTLTIRVTNNDGNYALTAVSLTDNLPTGLSWASSPNFSSSCGGSLSSTATSISLSGGSISKSGSCTVTGDVTSNTPGIYSDTIPANAIQTQQGVTNTAAASATLNVQSIGVAKAFAPTAFQQGGQSNVTITLSNPTSPAYTGVAFTDTLPAGLSLVPLSATSKCGGTVTSTGSSISLSGGTIPAGSISTPGTCIVTFTVTSSIAGTYTDSIPVGGVTTTQGASNVLAGTANLTVYATGLGLGGSKGFSPSSIPVGGTSRLTIDITAPPDTGISSLSLTDALPPGVQVAGTPSASTSSNCGSLPPPTFNPHAGDTSLIFTGGMVPIGAICSLAVNVTSSTPGTVTDTISPVNISDSEKRDVAGNFSASLNISGLSVSKAFYPPVVGANGISTLTISLTNTNTSQLDSVSLSDGLPGEVVIASVPNLSTTCPNAVITADAGTQSIQMKDGILPANVAGIEGLCTISVDVVGAGTTGTYTNTIAAGKVTGTIHDTSLVVSNPAEASASLRIGALDIGVVKGFEPLTVFGGSASTLTVLLSNPNNAVLTGISFTDSLAGGGGGMIVANPPAPSVGTCGGSLSATPGALSFTYSGGTLQAYDSCSLTLNVTMTVSDNLTNTISAGTVTSGNGAVNSQDASATLTNSPGASISKLFLENPISAGAGNSSTLQITIKNTGNTLLDGMGLNDTFPAGMTVASPPDPLQCSGTVNGTVGGGSITLAGGSLGAGSSCTIRVEVKAPTIGNYQDCIADGALHDNQHATNQKACDTLVVNPVLEPPSIGKSFSPNPIAAGGTSTLTFTITNPNPVTPLTGVSFADSFPGVLTVASVPNMAQCNGTVTSTAGSISLAGGTIGAGKSCTVIVSVTALTGGSYKNTSGQVSSTNGGTGNAATDTLDVIGPPSMSKAFNPASIPVGGTSTLTFIIANPNATDELTGVAFSDPLPSGMQVASSPNAGSSGCGTPTFSAAPGATTLAFSSGSVAAAGTCTVNVDVTAGGGSYTNTSGAVTSTNGGTGNTATAVLNVTGAGLRLRKLTSTPTYQHAGDTITYLYALANVGSVPLSSISVSDDHVGSPPGCSVASLNPGASFLCTATYTVTAGDITTKSITNQATASANAAPNMRVTSNPSSVTVYLEALTLTKYTSTAGYHATGDLISYNYLLTNTGAVTLYAPFEVTDDHIGSPPPTTFSCGSVTSLAPYANVTCSAPSTYKVTDSDIANGSVTNTATATAMDATSGGRTVTSPPSSVTVYMVVAPSIRKSFSPNPVAVGQSSVLTFTITNPSSNKVALTGVGFTDTLPSGVTVFTPPSGLQCGGSVTSTSNSIKLENGTVVPGGSCTVTVSVSGAAGGSYLNTSAAVSSTSGGTGNTASDTLDVVAPPSISKSFTPSIIALGGKSTVTFTLKAPPGNPVALAGVTFTDLLPTNLLVASPPNAMTSGCGSPTFSPAAGATTVSFSGGTIPSGGTCTVKVDVAPVLAGTYNNATGAVSSLNGGTGAPSNIATLTVNPSADLSVTKNDGLTGVDRGAIVTYVIVVGNAGPSNVVGASVTDAVPSSLLGATWTCVADAGASCTSSGSGNITDAVTIPVGKKVTYRLTATVSSTAATLIVNTASVLPPSGVTDSNLSNNSATDTDYLNRSPNACEISGIAFYDANSNGVYDSGDLVLSGVTITLLDQYGHVLTATATGSGGGYVFDNLLPGTYTVVQTNPAGYPINTTLDHVSVVLAPSTSAVVNFGDQKSTGAAISDPAVTKYASPDVARIGDTVTYTITVGNNGTTDASNVNLSDTLPSIVDLISITVSPNPGFPVTITGNAFTIQFGTVTHTDYYTVTVVTKVNGSAHPPGGVNITSITTSPLLGDLPFNDSASAYLTIYVAHLPATGFAPGRVSVLPGEANAAHVASSGMTIEIPALQLEAAIVGVPESGDSWDITWLGNDVGYLEGTAFPTWSGNSVLTGHVYGANGLPGPFVNLSSLKWGDEVVIHFDSQRYIYQVQTSAILPPDDTSAFGHKNLPWLTLVTCKDYNPLTNTYAHRVSVGAVLVKIESDAAAASPGSSPPEP